MTDLLDRPSPPERPHIDPRIARRWIDARREEGRRRLHLLLVLGGVVAAAALAIGSLFTPLFQVRHVRITVAGPMASATVQRLAGVGNGTLTIHVHTGAIAARLDADPWLGAARVTRHWPGTVDISVVVRSPLAVVPLPGATAPDGGATAGGSGGSAGSAGAASGATAGTGQAGWAEVDPTGRVLADLATPPPGMPVLQGVTSVPAPGGWLAGTAGPGAAPGAPPSGLVDMTAPSDGADVPGGPAAALSVLQSLPTLIRSDVLSVNANRGPGLSLVIQPPRLATGTVTVLLGDGSQLQSKVTALLAILDQGQLAGVAGLDLSVPSRPAVASSVSGLVPTPATGATPAATGGAGG